MTIATQSVSLAQQVCTYNLTPAQKQGIVDLFLAVTYVDGAVDKSETEFLDTILTTCGWNEDTALGQYISESRAQAIEAVQQERTLEMFIKAARVKVNHADVQKNLLELCQGIAASDDILTAGEKKLLEFIEIEFK